MAQLTHVDEHNQPTMVDVSLKAVSLRLARAQAIVKLTPEIMNLFDGKDIHSKKGPVFQTAIIAGVMAAKRTAQLIPFCHPINIEDCKIHIEVESGSTIRIECAVKVHYKTGVEMEALTGVTAAALTVYDMCKALSHEILITDICLIEKSGGKHDVRKERQKT